MVYIGIFKFSLLFLFCLIYAVGDSDSVVRKSSCQLFLFEMGSLAAIILCNMRPEV